MVDKKNSEIRCATIPLVSAALLWDALLVEQWVLGASVRAMREGCWSRRSLSDSPGCCTPVSAQRLAILQILLLSCTRRTRTGVCKDWALGTTFIHKESRSSRDKRVPAPAKLLVIEASTAPP